jgi:hypothetical protein
MNQKEVRLNGIRPTSVAMFEGTFGAVLGLAVAILYLLRGTVVYTQATDSLLQGLLLGLTVGAFSIIVLPVVYFIIGWVFGIVNGFVFNLILQASGGLRLDVGNDATEEMPAAATPRRSDPAFGERIDRGPRK